MENIKRPAKIGEFNAQKAETNFAGRKWIAWFTTDIPFQDTFTNSVDFLA